MRWKLFQYLHILYVNFGTFKNLVIHFTVNTDYCFRCDCASHKQFIIDIYKNIPCGIAEQIVIIIAWRTLYNASCENAMAVVTG